MQKSTHIQVIFPLALPRLYTYIVPAELYHDQLVGCRVEVELRNKLYAGIVYAQLEEFDTEIASKYIVSILDDKPIINQAQLHLWTWIAKYYCCSLGEVMEAGIPAGLKLSSESIIKLAESEFEPEMDNLSDDEYLITEALTMQDELSIEQVKHILNKKSIYPILKSLLAKNVLRIKEQLIEKYRPKNVKMIRLSDICKIEEDQIRALDSVEKYEQQYHTLLTIITLTKNTEWATFPDVKELCKTSAVVLNSLEKKGFIEIEKRTISRLNSNILDIQELPMLSAEQIKAIESIKQYFEENKPVLVHGVTGSGKTRLYQELIHDALSKGKQVLYLLPEIALTTQIVDRLMTVFGNDILLYHSRLGDNERVELWNEILKGKKLVLTARSGIFLPFTNLGLIIVDEEHDGSYKQQEPNPHYNARDVALYIAHQSKCNVILGSATPSLESYHNALEGKFGLITLDKRFGDVKMPKVGIVDLGYERKTGRYKPVISVPLQKEIRKMLDAKKQVILFQNRRGFVPRVQCNNCGWTAMCINCDVSLTLHKFLNELSCHYCSHKQRPPHACPECGNVEVKEIGSGTEKIELTINEYFPDAKVARLDLDTTKTKSAMDKIIGAFSIGNIDILIGTQMVTKGFDFDNVNLVGVIDADASLRIPDFRAHERSFQLLTQVAGRAGRRVEQGKVIIQTYSKDHPIILDTISNDYKSFFYREITERKQFSFPPFVRMIILDLLHKDLDKVSKAAEYITNDLKSLLGNRVQGPIIPGISRIRNQYIRTIIIKCEKDNELLFNIKKHIMKLKVDLSNNKEHRAVKIKIDVDPY